MQRIKRIVTLWSLLFVAAISLNTGVARSEPVPRKPVKVFGQVVFGDYEFLGPKGYWYYPRKFPPKGLKSGEDFIVTFFESKSDATAERSGLANELRNVVVNFTVLPNTFKDCVSYDQAMFGAYRSAGITEKEIIVKKPPKPTRKILQNIPQWCCNEVIANGYRPLFNLQCVFLGADEGVILAAIGNNQKMVLNKAPLLKQMVKSLRKHNKPLR